VLVDVDPRTHTIDVEQAERAVSPRTKAILAVHLYGGAADLEALASLKRRHSLKLVEDCAQAHGARWDGRRLGSFGDAAAFSFYPTKNLGAYGDGGAIASSDPTVLDRARLLRMYGWRQQYWSEIRGVNSRLDELQAAVLRAKLLWLDRWNSARRALAARYQAGLRGLGLPSAYRSCEPVHHLYVVRSQRRDELRSALAARGIGTGLHYATPVHLQPAYLDLAAGPGSLPETERAAGEVLSLPMYPELTEGEVDLVIGEVNELARAEATNRTEDRA
jgi:dTDP-4-amino-4,6-dideoxygalactose transaminase